MNVKGVRDDRVVADRPFLDSADFNDRRDGVTKPLAIDPEDVSQHVLGLRPGIVAVRAEDDFPGDIGLGGKHRARWLPGKDRRRLVDGIARHLDGREQKIPLRRRGGVPKVGDIFERNILS